jgi:hypothetical protein
MHTLVHPPHLLEMLDDNLWVLNVHGHIGDH